MAIRIKSYRLTDNLVAHYKMSDNLATTNVIDESGNYDGTAAQNTSVLSTAGNINKGFSFNGSSDYINCGTSLPTLSGGYTIAYWIYATSTSCTFSRSTGSGWLDERLVIHQYATSKLRITHSTGGTYGSFTSVADFPLNEWVHVAITWNTSTMQIYFNGEVDRDDAFTVVPADTGIKTWIGRTEGLSPDWTTGTMEDWRIYDTPITEAQVKALYNNSKGTKSANPAYPSKVTTTVVSPNNLVGHYKMNDNAASTVVTNEVGTNGTARYNTDTMDEAGKINGTFDRTGLYINTNLKYDASDVPVFNQSFSIAAWFKADDGQQTSYRRFFGCMDDHYTVFQNGIYVGLNANSGGRVGFYYRANNVSVSLNTSQYLPNGNTGWQHIVWTADADTGRFTVYTNGVYNNTALNESIDLSQYNGVNPYIYAMNMDGSWENDWYGEVDDFRLYDKVLSSNEVRALYNNNTGTEASNPGVQSYIVI